MPTLDAGQLTALRSQGHASHWLLYPVVTEIIFAAQINNAAITVGARTITFDNVTTGAYTDIEYGQTLWVGTAPGNYDIARIRIRSATSSTIKVAENADVAWADNYYLTVKKEWLCWSVRPHIAADIFYKDFDIVWTDQTVDWPPVAMMGDPAIALDSGSGADIPFDGSESYAVAVGATITSYAWDFDDGATSTAATPGNHHYAAGLYWPSLTVTDSNGKTHTGHRCVVVTTTEEAINLFTCQSLEHSGEGGWIASFSVFDPNATVVDFPERAPCFFFAADWFSGVAGSVGFPAGRENILHFGYIQDGSIEKVPETSTVNFSVESIAEQMGKTGPFPIFVMDAATPADWTQADGLDVFRSLIYLLKFHSTVQDISDVGLYRDTTLAKISDFPEGDLWSMFTQFGKGKRLLRSGVTRTGRVVMGRDPQLMTLADRTIVPSICQLEQGDWITKVTLQDKPFPTTSFLCLSGDAYDGDPSHDTNPYFGMSPGHPPKEFGKPREIQNMKLVDEAEAVTLAGLATGQDNNQFGDIIIPLAGNWCAVFEPALQEYIQAPATGFPSKRGSQLIGEYLIVRKVSITFDWPSGIARPQITCEAYSYPEIAVVGDCFDHDGPPLPRIPPITVIPPPRPRSTATPPFLNFNSNACTSGVSRNHIMWTPTDAVSPHYLERSLYLSSGYSVIFTDTTNLQEYYDSAISPGRTYYYRVRALVGSYYTRYSNKATQAVAFCVPTLTVTNVDCDTINLAWTNISGETVFRIERSDGVTGFVEIAYVGPNTLSYDDTPPAPGTWVYRVRGANVYTNGPYSNTASGTVGLDPAFHNHLVYATANHVYEFTNLGCFGSTIRAVPVDIKGNMTGTIIAFRNDSGQYQAIADNLLWRYAGGSVWVPSLSASLLAKNSGAWTHEWWAEDGTGIHGTAWWGGRGCAGAPFPCDLAHPFDTGSNIHWGYLSSDSYVNMIGGTIIVGTFEGNIADGHGCSQLHDGLWSSVIAAGVPSVFTVSENCLTATPPDVLDVPLGQNSVLSTPGHFSPYGAETFHAFVTAQIGFFGSAAYLDNVDVSSTYGTTAPNHVTDGGGNIWTWTAFGSLKKNGVDVLTAADISTAIGCPPLFVHLAGGNFNLNINPTTGQILFTFVNNSGTPHGIAKSTDGGTTWSLLPGGGTQNIFTVDGEDTVWYAFNSGGDLLLSHDNGTTWWTSYVGPGEAAVGVMVDPAS